MSPYDPTIATEGRGKIARLAANRFSRLVADLTLVRFLSPALFFFCFRKSEKQATNGWHENFVAMGHAAETELR